MLSLPNYGSNQGRNLIAIFLVQHSTYFVLSGEKKSSFSGVYNLPENLSSSRMPLRFISVWYRILGL